MAFIKRVDTGSASATPVARRPLVRPEKRVTHDGRLASGTLSCPRCDAPVALAGRVVRPADGLSCPFCAQTGPVRAFLSLRTPGRPARVAIRVRG